MIGRRATVGLSLLCALLFSVIAVQSASAAAGKNTTASTCVNVGTGKATFTDPHCDFDSPGKGNFEHQPLSSDIGKTTKVTFTNEKTASETTKSTPLTIKFKFFGLEWHIVCEGVHATANLGNTEPKAKEHRISLGNLVLKISKCKVEKPAKCTIKESFETASILGEGVEELGAGKNEMGFEVKPESGTTLATITFEGAECAAKGKSINLEGSMIATGGTTTQTEKQGGSTWVFTTGMTKETLKTGEFPIELSLALTLQMDEVGGKPIAFTTVT
jgi:hypothetical protein